MILKNPYLQAGVFLALMFTAASMLLGSLGPGEYRHEHKHEKKHYEKHQSSHYAGKGHAASLTYKQVPEVSVSVRTAGPEFELPTWPGCNDPDYEERILCTIEKLVFLLRDNLQPMPGHHGRVIVFYDVQLDGKINNSEVYEGKDPHLTAETMRMVGIMQGADIRWTPGTIDGKPEVLKFAIAINYGRGCENCAEVELFLR